MGHNVSICPGHGKADDSNLESDRNSGRKKSKSQVLPEERSLFSPRPQTSSDIAARQSDNKEQARPHSPSETGRSRPRSRKGGERRSLPPNPPPVPPENDSKPPKDRKRSSMSRVPSNSSAVQPHSRRPGDSFGVSHAEHHHSSGRGNRHDSNYSTSRDSHQFTNSQRQGETVPTAQSFYPPSDSSSIVGDAASPRQPSIKDREKYSKESRPQPPPRRRRSPTDHRSTSALETGGPSSHHTRTERPKTAMGHAGDRGRCGRDETQRHGSTRGGYGSSGQDVDGESPKPKEGWTGEQQKTRPEAARDKGDYFGPEGETDFSGTGQSSSDYRQSRAYNTTTIQVANASHADELLDKDTRIAKLMSVVDLLEQDKKKLAAKLAEAEKKAADERQNYNGLLENRIRQDPNNQNLNDKWRLEKVLQRFKELRDNGRLDFLDALEAQGDYVGETSLLKLACDIFMVCYPASKKFSFSLKAELERSLRSKLKLDDEISFSDGMMTELKFLLKEHLEQADKTPIVKKIMRELKESIPDWDCVKKCLEQDQDGKAFLDECVLLSCAMVVQHPPVEPVCNDGRFHAARHTLHAECRKGRKSIKHFVWPVVIDSVGGRVLEKGVVVTRSERKGSRKQQASQIDPLDSLETLV